MVNPLSLSLRQVEWARRQGGTAGKGLVTRGKITEDTQNGD